MSALAQLDAFKTEGDAAAPQETKEEVVAIVSCGEQVQTQDVESLANESTCGELEKENEALRGLVRHLDTQLYEARRTLRFLNNS